MSYCTNCGSVLTQEMLVSGMCFECGEEFILSPTDAVNILLFNENTITFPEIKSPANIDNSQIQIRELLKNHLESINSTPDTYLEKINTQTTGTVFATLKNNTDLFFRAVKKLETMTNLEIGERIFLFCSREHHTAVALYGDNNLISDGFLITNRRVLFWSNNKLHSLSMSEICSLDLNPSSNKWYLNNTETFTISNKCCDTQVSSLIFSLIFMQVKNSLGSETISVTKKSVKEENGRDDIKIEPDSSPLAEKLREAKGLYEEGLLTESEYTTMKKKILDKYI